MSPLTRCRAVADRVPTELMAEYYRQRAGAGLIKVALSVVEYTLLDVLSRQVGVHHLRMQQVAAPPPYPAAPPPGVRIPAGAQLGVGRVLAVVGCPSVVARTVDGDHTSAKTEVIAAVEPTTQSRTRVSGWRLRSPRISNPVFDPGRGSPAGLVRAGEQVALVRQVGGERGQLIDQDQDQWCGRGRWV